jgi:4-amino-4-deoxy-L-arabinose transferase-like glycosyltransferase
MAILQQILQPRSAWPSSDELPPQGEQSLRRVRGFDSVAGALRRSGELIVLIGLAASLNFWDLARNHWANTYYSAAIRSMTLSWHNFLYASFDPSGVMTIDKPPLAIWIEALSARIFGFHPLSILIPEALMGVVTVVLLYDLVRRLFGRWAGFIAGLALLSTPITVAMSRHNNPDALLTLCCVAALWFFVRAVQEDRTHWIVLSGLMVGLGFETKMAVALVVAPGIALAWLWLSPGGWKRAVDQLLAAGFAMLAVGAAWPLFVQLTPAASRPWIAGTSDNNIVSLILGYNGIGRVAGQNGGPPTGTTGAGTAVHGVNAAAGGVGVLNGVFAGATGPFRLLDAALGGQAGWLLGAALVAMIVIGASSRMRRSDPRSGWVIALGTTFVATLVVFSAAQGIFHPYYVSLIAPFAAALFGAGVGGLISASLGPRLAAVPLVAAGVACEIVVLGDYPGELSWVEPMLIGLGAVALLVLVAVSDARVRAGAIAATTAALLVAPSIWAVDTLGYATQPTFPAGGPAKYNLAVASFTRPSGGAPGLPAGPTPGPNPLFGGGQSLRPIARPGAPPVCNDSSLRAIIAFVKGHGGGPIGVSSQSNAAEGIICQRYDVAGIGGFSGRESNPTVAWFADEVTSGHIRWVYNEGAQNFGSAFDNRPGATKVLKAAARVCPQVNTRDGALIKPGTFSPSQIDNYRGLFDCAGEGAALGALAA